MVLDLEKWEQDTGKPELSPEEAYRALGFCQALNARFEERSNLADLNRAIELYEQVIPLVDQAEERISLLEGLALTRYRLGVSYVADGQWYAGLAQLQASLEAYRQTDNLERRADVLAQIARVHLLFGDWDRARLLYRDALRLYEHIDKKEGIATCHLALGRMMLRLDYLDDAQHELELARDLFADLNNPRQAEAIDVLEIVQKFKAKRAAMP